MSELISVNKINLMELKELEIHCEDRFANNIQMKEP